ncbi:HIT family protein [Desulfobacula phenolica]|uniref:Diadenosine tetraphosphate (Ap4A) hydrolase n=1 Tax=Desulfobacula phenolica TaxID=90732 RepID=A0A1H2GKI6_9BACT|nr:HIT family protein [Desulfobacula phenolica]SDU19908.1 Diadenosine tetraphosphate (Ap4A) hydrolase [Desulfobacula phenolica]
MNCSPVLSENNTTTKHCVFCMTEQLNILVENKTVFAIRDRSPVSQGHLLVIPKRHCIDYFEMTRQERCDSHKLIEILKEKILKTDTTVNGFNIGVNCGKTAGQTIFHAHIHLIPRRTNDTPNPRGGVRGVIPDKMNY